MRVGQVLAVLEHDRAAFVLHQLRIGGRLLDDRAAGRQVAAQHRDAALRIDRVRRRGRTTSCVKPAAGALDLLAQRAAGDRQRVEVQQRLQLAQQRRPCRRRGGSPPCSAGPRASGPPAPASRGPCGRAPAGRSRCPGARRSRSGGRCRWSSRRSRAARAARSRTPSAVRILSMREPSLAPSAPRAAPVRSATRMRSAVTAGGEAPPGTVMPSASAMHAIVLAVPITEQVPTLATSWLLTSRDLVGVDLLGAVTCPSSGGSRCRRRRARRGASR